MSQCRRCCCDSAILIGCFLTCKWRFPELFWLAEYILWLTDAIWEVTWLCMLYGSLFIWKSRTPEACALCEQLDGNEWAAIFHTVVAWIVVTCFLLPSCTDWSSCPFVFVHSSFSALKSLFYRDRLVCFITVYSPWLACQFRHGLLHLCPGLLLSFSFGSFLVITLPNWFLLFSFPFEKTFS